MNCIMASEGSSSSSSPGDERFVSCAVDAADVVCAFELLFFLPPLPPDDAELLLAAAAAASEALYFFISAS